METLNYKIFAFMLILLFGMGSVMALSIGNSIHINITIDNSTVPDNSSATNHTNTVIINNTDTTQANDNETTSDTTSAVENNDASDSSVSNSYSSHRVITSNNPDANVDSNGDGTNPSGNTKNQDSYVNSSLLTGASVFPGSGMSNVLKIISIIPTIVLAVIFILTYLLYRRKTDEKGGKKTSGKRKKKVNKIRKKKRK